jgi:hypothetical protein
VTAASGYPAWHRPRRGQGQALRVASGQPCPRLRAAPPHRRRTRPAEPGIKTKIHQFEVSTLSGDGRTSTWKRCGRSTRSSIPTTTPSTAATPTSDHAPPSSTASPAAANRLPTPSSERAAGVAAVTDSEKDAAGDRAQRRRDRAELCQRRSETADSQYSCEVANPAVMGRAVKRCRSHASQARCRRRREKSCPPETCDRVILSAGWGNRRLSGEVRAVARSSNTARPKTVRLSRHAYTRQLLSLDPPSILGRGHS